MKKNTGIAVSSYDKEKSFENASYFLRTYHDPDGEKKSGKCLLITLFIQTKIFKLTHILKIIIISTCWK